MVTKKYFKQIADSVSRIKDEQEKKRLANDLVPILAGLNPRFDSGKFLAACLTFPRSGV